MKPKTNTLVVLGPTASGKTTLGVALAHGLGGEILSADSRQVYRGLDIGSGKDLEEYEVDGTAIPYHLIDMVGLEEEFNVFAYQKAFFTAFEDLRARKKLPVVVGGTGLYLEAVLSGYTMVDAPENPQLRAELATLSDDELLTRLLTLKPKQHNRTDSEDRERLVRAIEIATHAQTHKPEPGPEITPLVLGTAWDRPVLRRRIAARLKQRLDEGMIAEVEALHGAGHSWERLELLGLEYRFVAQFLQGHIKSHNDLFQKLNAAIAQFAKRQETWFRRMEKRGTEIHWIPEADLGAALDVIRTHL
jgi:tRNA dimethylallyltransferase